MILRHFPPMGVYETLFKFAAATHKYMGEPGTHPWAQGFPLTTRLPGGPPLPDRVELTPADLKYPTATGNVDLRRAIARYYNEFYGTGIDEDHVAVFAGGRPAIFATLAFLEDDTTVAVEETEYTPYWDMLRLLRRRHRLIASNPENGFQPPLERYEEELVPRGGTSSSRVLLLKSNPCNPTGVTVGGADLKQLVAAYSGKDRGAVFDEAYEFFCEGEAVSAMRYITDIDHTNIFVCGAATKGLQVPGMRIGWVIGSKRHIEVFRNYSSFGMGGVSRASQLYVTQLLQRERIALARKAISAFYTGQRQRYAAGLQRLGFELFTGTGGFYHWAALPKGLTGDAFNERLMKHDAAILPGRLCDMARRGDKGPLGTMMRFSFGPLQAASCDEDLAILSRCV